VVNFGVDLILNLASLFNWTLGLRDRAFRANDILASLIHWSSVTCGVQVCVPSRQMNYSVKTNSSEWRAELLSSRCVHVCSDAVIPVFHTNSVEELCWPKLFNSRNLFRRDHGGMRHYQKLVAGQVDVATCFWRCVSTVRCIAWRTRCAASCWSSYMVDCAGSHRRHSWSRLDWTSSRHRRHRVMPRAVAWRLTARHSPAQRRHRHRRRFLLSAAVSETSSSTKSTGAYSWLGGPVNNNNNNNWLALWTTSRPQEASGTRHCHHHGFTDKQALKLNSAKCEIMKSSRTTISRELTRWTRSGTLSGTSEWTRRRWPSLENLSSKAVHRTSLYKQHRWP